VINLSEAKVANSAVLFCIFASKKPVMLLPFQRFMFVTSPSVKDLHRKFSLLLEQKIDLSGGRRTLRKTQIARAPLFTGTMEGDRFFVQLHKVNGEEDVVRVAGSLSHKDNSLVVELKLLFSGSWIVSFANTVVIALAAAFMYSYIGEKVFHRVLAIPSMPYLILTLTAIYINLRRYSNKAVQMLQQLVYWLELEDN
jgi:hypothetical protein